MRLPLVTTVALLCLAASQAAAADPDPAAAIRKEAILEHIKVLASDAFEGRAPGSAGEEKTVAYLSEQFAKMGLKPGNSDGSFMQAVPLVGFQSVDVAGSIVAGGKTITLKFPTDWVAVSRRQAEKMEVANSELVFVGYGVVAPEYGWDDYKGLDVRGKTLVMLVGDPPVPDPADPEKLDPKTFRGKAMTYYGRWTYKYEIASEKGASAVLLIHETGPAGYPYSVVEGSWGRENFDIATPGKAVERVAIESWINNDRARELLVAAGKDYDALKKAAVSKDFRPVPLNARATLAVTSKLREVKSRNVVAKVEGADPALKNEYVVYTAHWDHLGRDETLKGDQIFNGAADNASGTASLLEIAHAFAQMKPAPKRSILFLAVTAEEKGLLGAKYYAANPLYPLSKTLADINMDVVNLWGRTRDLSSLGLGQTTLDALIAEEAKRQDRIVVGDPEPEKGSFFRSDHFEFVRQGVPAVNARGGIDYRDRPADFGAKKRVEYTQNDYHKVSDEVKPGWDLSGAAEDLQLLMRVGLRVADGTAYPEWLPDAEFRAKRLESLGAAARKP